MLHALTVLTCSLKQWKMQLCDKCVTCDGLCRCFGTVLAGSINWSTHQGSSLRDNRKRLSFQLVYVNLSF